MRKPLNKQARIRATCVALVCGVSILGTTALAAESYTKTVRTNKAGDTYTSKSIGKIEVGEIPNQYAAFEAEDIYNLNKDMNELWDLQDKFDVVCQ